MYFSWRLFQSKKPIILTPEINKATEEAFNIWEDTRLEALAFFLDILTTYSKRIKSVQKNR